MITLTGCVLVGVAWYGITHQEARIIQDILMYHDVCRKNTHGKPMPWRLHRQLRREGELTLWFRFPNGLTLGDLTYSSDGHSSVVDALCTRFGCPDVSLERVGRYLVVKLKPGSPPSPGISR